MRNNNGSNIVVAREKRKPMNIVLPADVSHKSSTNHSKHLTNNEHEVLGEYSQQRIKELRKSIDDYYDEIPRKLRDQPDAQRRCLEYLAQTEAALTPPFDRQKISRARLTLTRIEIEMSRSKSAQMSIMIVAAIVYMFAAAAVFGAFALDMFGIGTEDTQLNQMVLLGIPLPIWYWGVIGSLTSMLLRAGSIPFTDRSEAHRWLLYRPIVGVVMGVLTYLLLITGLIVFVGDTTTRTPELLWVIAFAGSFSDTLSINLLHKALGRFEPIDRRENESKATDKTITHPLKRAA